MSHLPVLLASHAELQIRLIADNRNLSFMRGEADLALRAGRPDGDAALVMRKLGEIDFYVYGVAQYAGAVRERWPSLPWLGYDEDLAGTPETGWLHNFVENARPVLQASNVGTLARACVAGLGLALLPPLVAEPHGLVRLSSHPELRREIWLLAHRDAARLRRFSVVSDWIVNLVAEQGRKFDPVVRPDKVPK
ncbi:MAG: LysR substrate-binding domain-containing protein [Panacagrimonas sp.]